MATFQATPNLPGYMPQPSAGQNLLRVLSLGLAGQPWERVRQHNMALQREQGSAAIRNQADLDRVRMLEQDRVQRLAERLQLGDGTMTPEAARSEAARIITAGERQLGAESDNAVAAAKARKPYAALLATNQAELEKIKLDNAAIDAELQQARLQGQDPERIKQLERIKAANEYKAEQLKSAQMPDPDVERDVTGASQRKRLATGRSEATVAEAQDAAMTPGTARELADYGIKSNLAGAKSTFLGNTAAAEQAQAGLDLGLSKLHAKKAAFEASNVILPHGSMIFDPDTRVVVAESLNPGYGAAPGSPMARVGTGTKVMPGGGIRVKRDPSAVSAPVSAPTAPIAPAAPKVTAPISAVFDPNNPNAAAGAGVHKIVPNTTEAELERRRRRAEQLYGASRTPFGPAQ